MTFKEDLIPILLKLLKVLESREQFQAHSVRPALPNITCQAKVRQRHYNKKNKTKQNKTTQTNSLDYIDAESSTKCYQTNSDSMLKDYTL